MSPSMMILLGGILLLGLLVQLYMMRRNKRGIEAFLAKHPMLCGYVSPRA